MVKKISAKALQGDLKAGQYLIDRLCGPMDSGPGVAVQVNAGAQQQPPLPAPRERGRQLAEVHTIIADLMDERSDTVDRLREIAADAEAEELLS